MRQKNTNNPFIQDQLLGTRLTRRESFWYNGTPFGENKEARVDTFNYTKAGLLDSTSSKYIERTGTGSWQDTSAFTKSKDPDKVLEIYSDEFAWGKLKTVTLSHSDNKYSKYCINTEERDNYHAESSNILYPPASDPVSEGYGYIKLETFNTDTIVLPIMTVGESGITINWGDGTSSGISGYSKSDVRTTHVLRSGPVGNQKLWNGDIHSATDNKYYVHRFYETPAERTIYISGDVHEYGHAGFNIQNLYFTDNIKSATISGNEWFKKLGLCFYREYNKISRLF